MEHSSSNNNSGDRAATTNASSSVVAQELHSNSNPATESEIVDLVIMDDSSDNKNNDDRDNKGKMTQSSADSKLAAATAAAAAAQAGFESIDNASFDNDEDTDGIPTALSAKLSVAATASSVAVPAGAAHGATLAGKDDGGGGGHTRDEVIDLCDDDDDDGNGGDGNEIKKNYTATRPMEICTVDENGVLTTTTTTTTATTTTGSLPLRKRRRCTQGGSSTSSSRMPLPPNVDAIDLSQPSTNMASAFNVPGNSSNGTNHNDDHDNDNNNNNNQEDAHALYRRLVGPMRFDFVDTLQHHSFEDQKNDPRLPLPQIYKELLEYKLNLPIELSSSIFVRAVESRLDLVRALITGPEDTPYGFGCFLFDIYFNDYPRKAPKVKFLTTGNGRVRFNPNLYQCGKVCLSLLGTWSGPGWIPNQSTLLQVLVSIQGLILVPDPYFNEPGYSTSQKSTHHQRESKRYTQNIRRYTIQHAMIDYLQAILYGQQQDDNNDQQHQQEQQEWENYYVASRGGRGGGSRRKSGGRGGGVWRPPYHNKKKAPSTASYFPEFYDAMASHFFLRADAIIEEVQGWVKEDQTLIQPAKHLFSLLEELQQQQQHYSSMDTATNSTTDPAMAGQVEVVDLNDDGEEGRGREDDDDDRKPAAATGASTTGDSQSQHSIDGTANAPIILTIDE